ncbi:GNAT family N-acetyltransferase [Leptospira mtsangambouensis]|uniref:GNAT family N-acetyltransferase n=1 Tax=Leptospira mtsangambouensis TaxID=2484912 RepID=A0ABY2NVB7_9LEPT|nr:arsenic resistance N-acetyltransferase ArsN2 [Leptospira mtsangambouensis]MCG6140127.1 arsenic resistance N-acetyltransferase ArsN2 [Leptospira mtsangambouensis]TGM72403.1 GNAT family N-acetyltransferase [Leptospira mtsangambouensis]
MNILEFKNAKKTDLEQIIVLLEKFKLPNEDIHANSLIHFIIVKFNDQIIGTVALERFGNLGLLRSLCVEENYRNDNIGKSLINKILDYARAENILDVYLLTTTADKYFLKFGFEEISRANAPDLIQQSTQFRDICPSSAIFMHKKL